MVKTRRFISIFLFITFSFAFNIKGILAEDVLGEISLPPSSQPELNVSTRSSVFLPSKLIIGQKNVFIIKGDPGSKVSLAISNANRGAKPLAGKRLRLGETEKTIEAVMPATGVVEINYDLPEDESLINRVKYFEVALWKKEDFSDLELARTMSPSGVETLQNGVVISLPPTKHKGPSFAPVLPGVGQEVLRSLEHIQKVKDGKVSNELLDDGDTPAFLDSAEKRDIMLQNIDVINEEQK